MNHLGMFLRKLRIEHNEVLLDMAKRLKVSASEYQLNVAQRTELTEAVAESIKQVRVDIGNASPSKRNCALAFARSFDDLSDDDIQGLMAFLEGRTSQ